MPARPYILAESTWETVRNTPYEVAILPWGATEAHNRHLPYATDTMQCDAVAAESARLAWDAGAKVIVLPTVPFGVNTGQREVPLCLNMNPSTQQAVLYEIAESVQLCGVKKLLILNGHGGNDFKQIIRELQPKLSLLLCQIHWFRCVKPDSFFTTPGDHAGELETSVMLEIAADLVRPLSEAGPGAENPFKIRGFREGWAWTQRRWIDATDDTGTGNPYDASRDKGRKYLDAVAKQIAGFLVDLAAADIKDLHE
ncbi:MAG TPA: creatininase family protein [Planctomycetaceae bacterium]|nr:creatininase family protein [Planctomycetaceae bacterium]